MTRLLASALLVVALAVPGPAWAEERAAGEEDPAWRSYHLAFLALAEGREEAAREHLSELVRRHPEHPLAARARERARELGVAAPGAADRPRPADREGEEKTGLARAELVLGMTLGGVSGGALVCQALECDGPRQQAAATMLGGAAGLGLSLLATRDGITPGTSQLLSSSVGWGAWNSLLLVPRLDDDRDEALAVLAGEGAGLGLGALLAHTWRPDSGDVALTNTGGLWTTALVLLAHGVAGAEPELDAVVLAGDAGLLLGAGLSTQVDMSRGRTLLIDVGGVLGFLAGGLVAVGVIEGSESEKAPFIPMLAGTAGGLALSAYLTRDWDAPEPPASATLSFLHFGRGGFGAGVSMTLR